MEVFSTITSPVFSELVIVLEHDEIADLHSDIRLFETLNRMNEVRPFALVFLVIVGKEHYRQKGVLERLEDAISSAAAKGFIGSLDSRHSHNRTSNPEMGDLA